MFPTLFLSCNKALVRPIELRKTARANGLALPATVQHAAGLFRNHMGVLGVWSAEIFVSEIAIKLFVSPGQIPTCGYPHPVFGGFTLTDHPYLIYIGGALMGDPNSAFEGLALTSFGCGVVINLTPNEVLKTRRKNIAIAADLGVD